MCVIIAITRKFMFMYAYNSEDAKKSSFVRVRVYTAQCTLNCISITSDEKKVYISD